MKTIKIRSYEIGLHFRDGEFKGLLGTGRHWFFDPLGKVKVEVVSQRSPVAGPREARRDRQVGRAEGPRRRAGPEGLPAGAGVGGRPVQPHPAAGPVRLLDHLPGGRRRGDRRPQGPFRAQGPPGDRPFGDGRPAAGRLCRRAGPRRRAVRGRPLRRDPAAGQVCLLEEHGQGHARAGGPARDDAGHRRPGDHDRRQGHAASERGGDLPSGRRPQGAERGRRRPPGPVPRGPVGPAGGGRRPGARPVPGRQGRRGPANWKRSSGSGWLRWVWKSSRWASAT